MLYNDMGMRPLSMLLLHWVARRAQTPIHFFHPSELTTRLTRVQSASPVEGMRPGSFGQAVDTHLFISDLPTGAGGRRKNRKPSGHPKDAQ